jgi:gamma-F420-2:alpha-L-glutamate ligase
MTVWILSQHNSSSYENSRLVESFATAGIEVTLMHPDRFDIIVNRNRSKSIRYEDTSITMPKLVLTRTGSGTNYFSSAVMRQLERYGVPTLNHSEAINNVRDKLQAHQILSQANIPTPKTMLVKFPVSSKTVEQEIGFPCVVKVLQGSHGKGVHLVHTKNLFEDLMDLVDNLGVKKTMIVQEFVDTAIGTDLRVLVVGGKVVGAMKRKGPDGDFRANITNGGTGEPFPVSDEMDLLCRETAKALGLDIAGIDLLFDDQGFKVCEANSAPGFEGFEKYVDINVAGAIVDYVKFKLNG